MPFYLDHAATTPALPAVIEAMLPWWVGGNPASDHADGLRAKRAVETARAQVAGLIGALPEEILWTSGATEANNLALKGALEFRGLAGAHVISSRTEHKAVIDTLRYLEGQGVRVTWLKPTASGVVTPAQVIEALTPDTRLVSLMWVNNETGVIQDIPTLAPLLRARGVLLHVDAVQAVGKLPIDLSAVPVDLLSLSAHKFYGSKGAGALFVRKRPRVRLAPQLHGGGHEQGMRSGTLPTPLLVGMGVAAAHWQTHAAAEQVRLWSLRERLWQRLSALPQIHLNAAGAERLASILNVSFEGVEGESLRARLPDLMVSSGSACSAATQEPSYVLRALGRSDALAGASLRFSLGLSTTEAVIDTAAQQVIDAVLALRRIAGFTAP
jgi:cysteine desulfurase